MWCDIRIQLIPVSSQSNKKNKKDQDDSIAKEEIKVPLFAVIR